MFDGKGEMCKGVRNVGCSEGDMHEAASRWKPCAREEWAQATVEYAITIVVFMAIVSALALLWHAGADGVLARLVEGALSHALAGTGPLDIALY